MHHATHGALADFQQLEVDYCATRPDAQFAAPSQRNLQQVPVLRMYGVTMAGNSVCAFLHGFEPYFFCKCSDTRCALSPDDMPAFKEALNVRLPSSAPTQCSKLTYIEHTFSPLLPHFPLYGSTSS